MTGPKWNSDSCFPEIFNIPRVEAKGNIMHQLFKESLTVV